MLRASGGIADAIEFTSGDSASSEYHPHLTLTLDCECGITCLAPQGSAKVLLVVDDKNNLDTDDSLQQTLMESWGYSVNLISDEDSQATFDADVAANDVAYVSENVDPSTLGTKLTTAPIGVVNEEGDLNDELGMASSYSSATDNILDIIDNSHFISRFFDNSALKIFSLPTNGNEASGTLAQSLQSLGQWSTQPGIALLDTGDGFYGGGSAAGRRVMLPWGLANSFVLIWLTIMAIWFCTGLWSGGRAMMRLVVMGYSVMSLTSQLTIIVMGIWHGLPIGRRLMRGMGRWRGMYSLSLI